jgi:DNA-directed RNA polymerase subunit M/transcription elongation factor TFIIS
MSHLETHDTEVQNQIPSEVQTQIPPAFLPAVRSKCPDCKANLVVLRVIGGRAGSEYWTMRCTRCGGIHLDIISAPEPVVA